MIVKVILISVAIKHFILGLSILRFPDTDIYTGPIKITSALFFDKFFAVFSDNQVGMVLTISSIVSIIGVLWFKYSKFTLGALSIQFWFTLLGAAGGLEAVKAGMYASGTVLPREFIANDQLVYLMIVAYNLIASYEFYKPKK